MEVEGVRSADRVGCFRNPSEREGKKIKIKIRPRNVLHTKHTHTHARTPGKVIREQDKKKKKCHAIIRWFQSATLPLFYFIFFPLLFVRQKSLTGSDFLFPRSLPSVIYGEYITLARLKMQGQSGHSAVEGNFRIRFFFSFSIINRRTLPSIRFAASYFQSTALHMRMKSFCLRGREFQSGLCDKNCG